MKHNQEVVVVFVVVLFFLAPSVFFLFFPSFSGTGGAPERWSDAEKAGGDCHKRRGGPPEHLNDTET
jgi:hypothetical protein